MAASNDSDDLEALFDEISDSKKAQSSDGGATATMADIIGDAKDPIFSRLGKMTRAVNETLRQLATAKALEKDIANLADTKAKLEFVANSAEKVVGKINTAADAVVPVVDQVNTSAEALGKRWEQLCNNQVKAEEMRQLALDTKAFFNEEIKGKNDSIKTQLNEILATKEIQNLNGEIIKSFIALALALENGLLNVLLQVVPDDKKNDKIANLRKDDADASISQDQVNDLLGSLGF